MSGLLEIAVRHAADAKAAEAGGATRLQVRGSLDFGGLSPEPAVVAAIRRVTTLPVRPVVRLREGFTTDGGEAGRLKGLIDSYRAAGAEGVVLGFLNGHTEIDEPVIMELLADCDFGWTFSRAVDALSPPTEPGVLFARCRVSIRSSQPARRAVSRRASTILSSAPGPTGSRVR